MKSLINSNKKTLSNPLNYFNFGKNGFSMGSGNDQTILKVDDLNIVYIDDFANGDISTPDMDKAEKVRTNNFYTGKTPVILYQDGEIVGEYPNAKAAKKDHSSLRWNRNLIVFIESDDETFKGKIFCLSLSGFSLGQWIQYQRSKPKNNIFHVSGYTYAFNSYQVSKPEREFLEITDGRSFFSLKDFVENGEATNYDMVNMAAMFNEQGEFNEIEFTVADMQSALKDAVKQKFLSRVPVFTESVLSEGEAEKILQSAVSAIESNELTEYMKESIDGFKESLEGNEAQPKQQPAAEQPTSNDNLANKSQSFVD